MTYTRGALKALLASKPWLIPIVAVMVRCSFAVTTGELAERVGVRSPLVKRALWWLSKADAIVVSGTLPRRYRLRGQARIEAEEILRNSWQRGRRLALKQGSEYLLVAVRPTRISVRAVPVELVKRVHDVLRVGGCFKPVDVASALGISVRLASLALSVLQVSGKAARSGGCYSM